MRDDLMIYDKAPANLTEAPTRDVFCPVAPSSPPSIKRLPPLNSLRAFVVTAKYLSFTKAARELHVTSGAVSQQVKLLEEHLDCTLFRRTKQALLLTGEGRACLPGLIEAFSLMGASLAEIHSKKSGSLEVLVPASLAAKWLIPRLEGFQKQYPDIDVRIAVAANSAAFDTTDFDCAIRYGNGNYPGLQTEKIMGESVFPVCAPKLARALRTVADLKSQTFLHDESADQDPSCPDWGTWLRAAGVRGANATRGLRFDQSSLVIEAAIAGQGVALAKARLVSRDIHLGRLARPYNRDHLVKSAYYFLSPRTKCISSEIQLFKAWVQAEASFNP